MPELNETEKIYMLALCRYGLSAQIDMVFEEFAECQKELCKYLRGKRDVVHIAEEIADVEIMLDQMKLFLSLKKEVELYKKKKILRLAKRLVDHQEPELKEVSHEEDIQRAYDK